MEAKLITQADEQLEQFADFTLKEMRKSTRSMLRQGIKPLATQTRKNLLAKMPNARRPSKRQIRDFNAKHKRSKKYRQPPRYSDRLVNGIVYGVVKKGTYSFVHVKGHRKPTSGTFRLRFFEKGTKLRKHKNGRVVGKIKALRFFKSAHTPVVKEQMRNAMQEQLFKVIAKINASKK